MAKELEELPHFLEFVESVENKNACYKSYWPNSHKHDAVYYRKHKNCVNFASICRVIKFMAIQQMRLVISKTHFFI